MNNKEWICEILDILFIMILCFATLLSAMLIKGSEAPIMNYNIDKYKFGIMLISIGLYVMYVIRESEKGLGMVLYSIYGEKKVVAIRKIKEGNEA